MRERKCREKSNGKRFTPVAGWKSCKPKMLSSSGWTDAHRTRWQQGRYDVESTSQTVAVEKWEKRRAEAVDVSTRRRRYEETDTRAWWERWREKGGRGEIRSVVNVDDEQLEVIQKLCGRDTT
jgi:hypothetical protein